MVLSPGVAGKLSKEDVSAIQSGNPQLKGRYFTEKVPYGYNYADQNSSVIDTAVEDPAYNHGMHVAGIIGANCQSQAEINAYNGVRGAAPECQLLAMKIFSNTANVSASEADIIEKIDIGGISLIRAGAKNFKDVVIVPSKAEYKPLLDIISKNGAQTTLEDRRWFATRAFGVSSHYDTAIHNWFEK